MRSVLTAAAVLVLLGACKKTGEGEYQVQTPDVKVSTDTHTVQTPTVQVGRDTHIIDRPSLERKGDTITLGRKRDTIVTPEIKVRRP